MAADTNNSTLNCQPRS